MKTRPAIVFGGGQEYLVGRAGVHDEAPAESETLRHFVDGATRAKGRWRKQHSGLGERGF